MERVFCAGKRPLTWSTAWAMPGMPFSVTELSDLDVQYGDRLVSIGVMFHECLELVVEVNDPVNMKIEVVKK
jgi:hypothetical protein